MRASIRTAPAIEQLREAAVRHGVSVADSYARADRDEWLNLLLAHLVEPHLGQSRPTILHGYPGSQAALAQTHGDPPVAERFELYVRGIELANGYHELTRPGSVAQAQSPGATTAGRRRQAGTARWRAGYWRPWRSGCPTAPAWPWAWTEW